MAKIETFNCRDCNGIGRRLVMHIWPLADWVRCEECEGTGKKDYVSFDSTAEAIEWLGTDVEG